MPTVHRVARKLLRTFRDLRPGSDQLAVTWHRRGAGTWLDRIVGDGPLQPPHVALEPRIEELAAKAEDLGTQPLWDGYREVYARDPKVPGARSRFARSSEQVRSQPVMGRFFAWLVDQRRPGLVVEFGSAFGVSGMYWLAGLQAVGGGRLLTFEPNPVWQPIAAANLAQIGGDFTAVHDTFEAAIDGQLRPDERIDLAFVDAIHTPEFVRPQVELVVERLAPGGLVLVDDIHFSAEMTACWDAIAADPRFVASAALGQRVGLLELPG